MEKGRLIINRDEAEIVRYIFDQYIKGSSLKDIADKLTRDSVPYSEKNTNWGKARVARILDNRKYLGDEEHERIVEDNLFYEAASQKSDRMTAIPGNMNAEIGVVRDYIRCATCGTQMTRKANKKNKTYAIWYCANPDCGCRTGIPDEILIEKITLILNRIHNNERLLNSEPKKKFEIPPDLKRQLDEELHKDVISQQKVLQIIRDIASAQYDEISESHINTSDELKRRIRRIEIQDSFNPDLFRAITETVRMGNGKLELITRNNIAIGERYGDNKDTEEDSNGDNA